MTPPLRVLLADDHPVFRKGLRALLTSLPEATVVGEAADGEQAVRLAVEQEPDVVVMDLNMPGVNGVEATRRIIAAHPGTTDLDMLELAPRLDHAILFSGDSDFRRLVEAMQRKGVRVSVVSSIRTSPPMVADELRRQADQFMELAEIAPEFTRRQTEPRVRSVPLRQTPAEPFPDPHDAA